MLKTLMTGASAIALLLAGPATAQTAPAPAAAAATVDADPALWVLKDADTTIYLFGTVHVLKPGLSWFDDGVKKAFDESGTLVLELPDIEDPANQSLVAKLAVDPSGKPLTGKLTEEERATYTKALAGLGVPAQAFETYKPWFVAVNLGLLPLLKLGYDPNSGAEKTLMAAAKAAHKRISGFETTPQQLGYFDGLPERLQIKYLNETVKDIGKAGTQIDTMVAQWGKGDPDGLAATLNEGIASQPELYKVLLADRNKRWAVVLKDMLNRPGTIFVAVGAGHLAGRDSVQQQLKRLGLTTTRVSY